MLIKIGTTIINTRAIAFALDRGDHMLIGTIGGGEHIIPQQYGDVVREWLDSQALDLMDPGDPDERILPAVDPDRCKCIGTPATQWPAPDCSQPAAPCQHIHLTSDTAGIRCQDCGAIVKSASVIVSEVRA